MKKPTIYDVADLANVSVSTVSRYLNRTSYIVEEKIVAIELAMSELEFIPQVGKVNAKNTAELLIGVTVPTFDNLFINSMLSGMDKQVQNSAYRLLMETSSWDRSREIKAIHQMLKQGIDGLIVMLSCLTDAEIKKLVGDMPVLILAGIGEGMCPSLKIDNFAGGKIVTDFLLRLGHRRIVHIHGEAVGMRDSNERIKGYKQSLKEIGVPFDDSLLLDGGYEASRSSSAIQKLIDQKVSFTAVFAANDLSAYGIVQTLHQNNIRVPQQVSVIGFDDLFTSSIFVPKLTTIRQPLKEMGELSILYMQDLIKGRPREYSVPLVELIERDSTATVPEKTWVEELNMRGPENILYL